MKLLKLLISVILCVSLLSLPSLAKEEGEMHWFFKSKGDNSRPEILGGSPIPKEYGALYIGNPDDKTIYLTFDAGYSNESLEKTLDALKNQNVKGAFFILPGIIKNSPEIVKRMIDEGHLVCNHSTHHCNMASITDFEEFKKELQGIEIQYKEAFGVEMEKFFRPPEGAFSKKTLEFCQKAGYAPVFWSFAYADWDKNKQPDPQKTLNKILNSAHNGMVMLLHPTSKTNGDIMEEMIIGLKNQGYRFGTLKELAEVQKS